MKSIDLSNVQEAEQFTRVKPGGYICTITSVEDIPEKEYLKIEYDIAYGNCKGYYRKLYNERGFWGASTIKSYKDSALPFFKGFITAVEKSNAGYHWDSDESKLVGKNIGFVLCEEEYQTKNGDVKTRLYVASVHSVEKIQANDFKVPELKKLKGTNRPASTALPAGDMSDFAPAPSFDANECPFA